MGVALNISFNRFPKQGDWLHRRAKVCFHYDLSNCINGTIIREDMEEPCETIIMLEDGRVVRSTECQYTVLPREE